MNLRPNKINRLTWEAKKKKKKAHSFKSSKTATPPNKTFYAPWTH